MSQDLQPPGSRSIFTMIPDSILRKHQQFSTKSPELFGKEETELVASFKSLGFIPNATDNVLRLRFWTEYDQAHDSGRKIHLLAVIAGVCTDEYFYSRYLTDEKRVAWLFCRPMAYKAMLEEGLTFSLKQMREFLELPNVSKKGIPNVKLMELKAKIFHLLDARLNGSVVQRVEQKSLHVHTTSGAKEAVQDMTMDDMEARIKRLEKKAKAPDVMSDVVDIEIEGEQNAPEPTA